MSMDSGFVPAESVTVRDTFAVLGRRWRDHRPVRRARRASPAADLHPREGGCATTSHAAGPGLARSPSNQFAGEPDPDRQQRVDADRAEDRDIGDSAPMRRPRSSAPASPGSRRWRNLTVTVPATTQILDFAYSARNPKAAQAGAKAFAGMPISRTARQPPAG